MQASLLAIGVELPPPPTDVVHSGGGGDGWSELVTARNDIDAHLLLGRLAEAGVEARGVKDRRAAGAWLFGGSNPWAPVAVWVRTRQLDDARIVLAQIELDRLDRGAHAAADPDGVAPRRAPAWWAVAVGLGVVLALVTALQGAGLAAGCAAGPQRCTAGARP